MVAEDTERGSRREGRSFSLLSRCFDRLPRRVGELGERMQVEEDRSGSSEEVDLPALEEALISRLNDKITSIRIVYRRDYSIHALAVRWMFGVSSAQIYEVLVEITSPYQVGEDLWPFTMEEEMDLLHEREDRWDVDRVFVQNTRQGRQHGTVVLRRSPNRRG